MSNDDVSKENLVNTLMIKINFCAVFSKQNRKHVLHVTNEL